MDALQSGYWDIPARIRKSGMSHVITIPQLVINKYKIHIGDIIQVRINQIKNMPFLDCKVWKNGKKSGTAVITIPDMLVQTEGYKVGSQITINIKKEAEESAENNRT